MIRTRDEAHELCHRVAVVPEHVFPLLEHTNEVQ